MSPGEVESRLPRCHASECHGMLVGVLDRGFFSRGVLGSLSFVHCCGGFVNKASSFSFFVCLFYNVILLVEIRGTKSMASDFGERPLLFLWFVLLSFIFISFPLKLSAKHDILREKQSE